MMQTTHNLLAHAQARRDRSRSGQVMIFFIMILVILTFMSPMVIMKVISIAM